MAQLKLALFGAPRITRDGQRVQLGRAKALALLAYLAVGGQPYGRDTLMGLLWPEFDEASARNNLRRELSLLRSLLGEHTLLTQGQQVAWNPQAGAWLDVAEFQALLDEAGRLLDEAGRLPAATAPWAAALAAAVALAGEEFLAGLALPECPAFEEWQLFQRETLRQRLAEALAALVGWYGERGEHREALGCARRWLALDPLHEPAQRALIRAYALAGQHSAALRQYDACARLLDAELGVAPEAETRELYEAIRARRIVARPAAPPPAARPAEPPPAPGQAPQRAQATSFVGREKEVADIRSLVIDEPDCRLLTLVGPGGIGKTRLALAAAESLADALPHGSVFVSLASLARAELIAPAVAEALHLTLSAGADPRAQLFAHLREKRILLVLDNYEQLLAPEARQSGPDAPAGAAPEDGAAFLSELLRAAPAARLLVTSRERLNLREEWCYEVQGMRFPQARGQLAGKSATQLVAAYDAVLLFVERARRAEAGFTLTADEAPHVARICQLLEGMPLGLELAASWVRVMTPRQIAEEIAGGPDFLTAATRNLPERHRSLRAVFEQTWQRLAEAERRALARLSAFSGGCTRQAAEEVAGATLPVLAALVDRALLRRSGGGRYEMHELLRQYAAEKLQALGETPATREAHARYYAALLKGHEADLKGPRQLDAVVEIAADLDNIRASWRLAVERGDADLIAQAQDSLYHFYETQGQAREGARAFQEAAAALRASPRRGAGHELVLGQVVGRQGFLANRVGLFARSLELMHESMELLRRAGPAARAELALTLHFLGGEVYFQGNHAEAQRLLREGLDLAMEVGDDWLLGGSWQGLGQTAEFQGEYAEAVAFFRHSIEAYRRAGEQRWRAYALNNWGRAAYAMGEYAQARELIGEALEIRQSFSDLTGMGYSLLDLGKLAALQGQYAQARAMMEQGLALCEEIGDHDQVARCKNGLGSVARLLGELDQAEVYHQSSLAAYNQMGIKRELPLTMACLGQVAYDQGDYALAGQRFRESLRVSEAVGNPGGAASALRFLGHVAGVGGREAEARGYYQRAIEIVTRTGAAPIALDVLYGWATLLARRVSPGPSDEQAHDLARLVARHPAAPHELAARARGLLRALFPDPPVDEAGGAGPSDDWRMAAARYL